MVSGVGNSTVAETLPVCSIVGYYNWVEFLTKWPEHLRGDAFWKSKKIEKNHFFRFFFSKKVEKSRKKFEGRKISKKKQKLKVCKMQFGCPTGSKTERFCDLEFLSWTKDHQKTTFVQIFSSKTRKICNNFTKTTRRKRLSDQIIWITWFSWTLYLSGSSPIFSVRTNLAKFLIHLE
jgi:hypothetical protein